MAFTHFSKNGNILPIEKAVIALSHIEYQYGFGVYENIRVSNKVTYFIKDHIERLMGSAEAIGLAHPFDAAFVEKSIRDLSTKNDAASYNLKILLIGGAMKETASLYILCLNPLFPDKKLYTEGAHLITYEYERAFPHAKTLNMLESYLAYKKAREAGAYDALLIDRKGCITEGTRTNFLCINEHTIYTPKESGILLGVMRKAVLKVARQNGFKIEECDMPYSDISRYGGAFITSTSSKIVPVRSIDAHAFPGFPPSFRELMWLFDAFLENCAGILPV